jgi:hypothetical protein
VNEISKVRLGLIPVLAERHPAGHIGRTALMKYMYFLQTLRRIPLGYRFSMYSYGPFDSDVLSDLSTAEGMNIVSSTPVSFSGGYGYEIRPGASAAAVKQGIDRFLADHESDIEWLFREFADLNSADLELASTVVYVDQEFSEGQDLSSANILTRVQEIKPHFSMARIQSSVDSLCAKGLLAAACGV